MKKGCAATGIPYGRNEKNIFTLHDLSYILNIDMRKSGISESVIMTVTGHNARTKYLSTINSVKSLKEKHRIKFASVLMFDRYNTIDESDIQEAVGKMAAFLGKCSQIRIKKGS